MGVADLGITATDFTGLAETDFGESLTWEDSTTTIDPVTGHESIAYAGGASKTAVFVKKSQQYQRTPEGLLAFSDAVCYSRPANAFAKNDRLTYNSEKFIIDSIVRRRADGTDMFDTCFLKRVS